MSGPPKCPVGVACPLPGGGERPRAREPGGPLKRSSACRASACGTVPYASDPRGGRRDWETSREPGGGSRLKMFPGGNFHFLVDSVQIST